MPHCQISSRSPTLHAKAAATPAASTTTTPKDDDPPQTSSLPPAAESFVPVAVPALVVLSAVAVAPVASVLLATVPLALLEEDAPESPPSSAFLHSVGTGGTTPASHSGLGLMVDLPTAEKPWGSLLSAQSSSQHSWHLLWYSAVRHASLSPHRELHACASLTMVSLTMPFVAACVRLLKRVVATAAAVVSAREGARMVGE